MCRQSRHIKIVLEARLCFSRFTIPYSLLTKYVWWVSPRGLRHRIVVPAFVGSNPISHPIKKDRPFGLSFFIWVFVGDGIRKAVKKTVRWTVFSGRGIREVFALTRRIKRAEQRHLADTKVGGAKIRWFKSSDQRQNDNTALEKCLPVTLTFKRAVNPTLI